ncbi:hypothetical protein ALC62_07469, partial [Cyphomyrmex costatus]
CRKRLPMQFSNLRDRRSVGRRERRRSNMNNCRKGGREEPLELRFSRNEGWRTERKKKIRIRMVQLGRDRECQKTRRRPFSADGWNRASPMASIPVDALRFRYNDIGKNVQFFTTRQVSPDTIAPSRKPHSRVLPAPKRSSATAL